MPVSRDLQAGDRNDHIFGIPEATLHIHYTTLMEYTMTIKGSLLVKISYRRFLPTSLRQGRVLWRVENSELLFNL